MHNAHEVLAFMVFFAGGSCITVFSYPLNHFDASPPSRPVPLYVRARSFSPTRRFTCYNFLCFMFSIKSRHRTCDCNIGDDLLGFVLVRIVGGVACSSPSSGSSLFEAPTRDTSRYVYWYSQWILSRMSRFRTECFVISNVMHAQVWLRARTFNLCLVVVYQIPVLLTSQFFFRSRKI